MPESERILVVGGSDVDRERIVADLRRRELKVEARGGLLEDAEDAGVVVVVGGAITSKRDGVAAWVDAVSAARIAAAARIVFACVPDGTDAEAVEALYQAGADEVLVGALAEADIAQRIKVHAYSSARRRLSELNARQVEVLESLSGLLSDETDWPNGLPEFLSRLSAAVGFTRSALLLIEEDRRTATLVASSEESEPVRVQLELKRYPEIQACLEERKSVLVCGVRSSPLFGPWADLAATHGGEAMLATPIDVGGHPLAALLFRSYLANPPTSDGARAFLTQIAQLIGVGLRSGTLERLRDQTRRTSLRLHEEERRSRVFLQYQDFCESAPDGMVVVDEEGNVLLVNRAFETMTGYARAGLADRSLASIVETSQREALLEIVAKVAGGVRLEEFDLELETTSGEMRTVNVVCSIALSQFRAAVLALRDVTEERRLAAELRSTKEFLERLIDSTVDGIVAADLKGNVRIFNRGAAQLFGYTPEQVIGTVPVWQLYPDGVARRIMAEMRSSPRGRLQPQRLHIVTKNGAQVPAHVAASIVYAEGREIATVGVVSDLRDRVHMEERLSQAQAELERSEKQMVLAELAGATAHELNQPLTSLMWCAGFLRKKLGPQEDTLRAAETIATEAERMAEIVRKIGQITHYETKPYVGSTHILDLEKSAPHSRSKE